MANKKKPTIEKGIRLSIWFGDKDKWMIKVVKRLQREAESKGIPITESEILRRAIHKYLSDFLIPEDLDK